MPMHFDRFRLLNGGSKIRNESNKPLYVYDADPEIPLIVGPGEEVDLPTTVSEIVLEVLNEEP